MTSPLERPPKKQRLESPSHPFPPSPLSSQPPAITRRATADKTIDDIEAARAHNDSRLKSAFEHIFEKYGRDFSDVGDEIDLQTGGIIIDNGHVEAMTAEGDTGDAGGVGEKLSDSTRGGTAWGLAGGREENEYEEAYALSELGTPEPAVVRLGNISRYEPSCAAGEGDDSDSDDGSSIDSLFDVEPDSFRQGAGTDTNKTVTTAKANFVSEWPTLSRFIGKDKYTNGVDATCTGSDAAKALSTPTWNKPQFHSTIFNGVRSASPPGARSLWSLPRRRGRPSTGGTRRYKKRADPTPNRNPRPTPVTQHCLSGDSSDGSESDDPLQEDHQTLPTPTPVSKIRGRRLKSPAQSQDQSPRPDYMPNLKLSTPAKPEDGFHITKVTRNGDPDTQSTPVAPGEPHDVNTPDPKSNGDSLAAIQDSARTKPRRPRPTMTPNEAKLVMKLRQVEKMRWNDIANYLPERNNLRQWSHHHFSKLQKDPPRLSRPWSHEELVKLDLFKDLDGLTWAAIQSEFPGRPHAELEFALLCLWAGNEACGNNQIPGTRMSTNGQSATG